MAYLSLLIDASWVWILFVTTSAQSRLSVYLYLPLRQQVSGAIPAGKLLLCRTGIRAAFSFHQETVQ